MKLLRAYFFLSSGWLATTIASVDSDARRVAVIGAGAAGASAAYHLRQFADEDGVPINITVFEKTDHIGGRTLTVDVYDDPEQRVELGASIFVQINQIMWNATKMFDLPLRAHGGEEDGQLGIWDGEQFLYTQDESSSDWWNLAKLFWKYGTAPYWTNKLVQKTVTKFMSLYEAPYFPFRSLTTRAFELELAAIMSQTGQQLLAQNKISIPFSHDIIQASTRVNFASNLAKIHGLDTMVSLAPQGASQVEGGNWQIFSNFVRASKAEFRGNTSVESITLAPSTTPEAPKYLLQTKSATKGAEKEVLEFDSVVLATPYQLSGITTGDGVLQQTIEKVSYAKLHVTLFASPLLLSPEFFHLPPDAKAPTMVLTTLGPEDDAESGVHGAGTAGFFSISTLCTVMNPRTGLSEHLYKIFSPEKVTAGFLTQLLGAAVPDLFTGPVGNDEGSVDVISWYYPYVFQAYPKALPRVTFQDPILGNGLYYTSGMEGFISTMETCALSGKNVARLLVDDLQGLTTGEAVRVEVKQEEGEL